MPVTLVPESFFKRETVGVLVASRAVAYDFVCGEGPHLRGFLSKRTPSENLELRGRSLSERSIPGGVSENLGRERRLIQRVKVVCYGIYIYVLAKVCKYFYSGLAIFIALATYTFCCRKWV